MKNRKRPDISDTVIARLSRYHSSLYLLEQDGIEQISSDELGIIEGVSGAQVRRDLSFFGSFGKRGKGYNVIYLKDSIAEILGLRKKWSVAIVGTGQIGNVLIQSEVFGKKNLFIKKIFDDTGTLAGKKISDIIISDLSDLEKELDPKKIDIAIIAMPPARVQSIVDRLARIGIKGALYFASRSVIVPVEMNVRKRDISVDLGILTYHMTRTGYGSN